MPVIIYSKVVGDLFHIGHVRFLREAKALGDRLIVQVVSDERVAVYKRVPFMSQHERAEVVASCVYVDEVHLEGPKTITLDFMDRNGFEIYAYGYSSERESLVKRQDCIELPDQRIRIIPYTPGISTTDIIDRVLTRGKNR